MTFVQYYHKGAVSGDLIPACGDRAVVILDGRNRFETMVEDAIKFNGYRRPVYEAFQLFQGDSFTRCKAISEITLLKGKREGYHESI